MGMQKTKISYCGDYLRTHDPDKFLISLLVPADKREGLWALFAFNHEISKTRDVVSEITLGLIRLQWWRDAIAAIYGGDHVPAHEVLKPLAQAIKRYDLPQAHFDKLIYAREFDLEDVLPGNIEGLLNYADFTTTPLLQLAVQITDKDYNAEDMKPVAVNFALAGILRRTAFYAHQDRVLLPEDLMQKYSLTKLSLFEDNNRKNLKSLVKEAVAHKYPLSKSNNVILKACNALSDIYFKHLKSLDYDVMSPVLHREPPFKALRLFWKTKYL